MATKRRRGKPYEEYRRDVYKMVRLPNELWERVEVRTLNDPDMIGPRLKVSQAVVWLLREACAVREKKYAKMMEDA